MWVSNPAGPVNMYIRLKDNTLFWLGSAVSEVRYWMTRALKAEKELEHVGKTAKSDSAGKGSGAG